MRYLKAFMAGSLDFARDDEGKLRRFRLLPETPAPMRDTQFCDVLGIEWDVRMTAHRCDQ